MHPVIFIQHLLFNLHHRYDVAIYPLLQHMHII